LFAWHQAAIDLAPSEKRGLQIPVLQALALPPDSSASILEYGSGSGQLLLFLARMGLDVYAVDIDQPSLDLVSAQARAMGLDVKCECALFGEGFSDKKFDRIIFFEAFHGRLDDHGRDHALQGLAAGPKSG
jgi:2-polyprenyl-3-methyl-5-hydroxy-6-metoxy-1,4-benzoquinol methylase